MKNLSDFRSFINHLNEAEESMSAPLDWDPKKAQSAIDKAVKQTGGSNKDNKPTGLSFNNVKQVFGKNDYTVRYVIAQALKIAGKDLFQTNSYNPTLTENKKREIENSDKPYFFNTYYIGEVAQNETMDKISKGVLTAIKPLVTSMLKAVGTEQDKYYTSSATKLPEVAKAKIDLSKVK